MAVNEVVVNGVTELSLVNDTVSEEALLDGTTAHDASGNLIGGKAKYINPNLLINPDFSINQRGQTEYSASQTGIVDGWKLYKQNPSAEDKVTIADDGLLVLNLAVGNWIRVAQIFETPLSGTFTFSAAIESATPGIRFDLLTVDSSTSPSYSWLLDGGSETLKMTFDVKEMTSLGLNIRGDYGFGFVNVAHANLIPGSVDTPFVKPNLALESIKCQRMLQYHTKGDINPVDLRPIMRITPTVVQQADGRWMYNAEL